MLIEKTFKQTLEKIKLSKKEKILVALSGGKDSTVTAYLLKKFGYRIEGIYVDLGVPGYSNKCLEAVEKLCSSLDIKLYVYSLKKEQSKTIKDVWKKTEKLNLNHCAACGVIKKWILNKEAIRLDADKIATGHNLDDEVQTFLLNILKGSPQLSLNSGAITKNILDKKFVSRVKPLFYIPESKIREYAQKKKLPFVDGKCPFVQDSYRFEIRKFTDKLLDKEKENMMKNAEGVLKRINKNEGEIKYCVSCGEPTRNKICKMCELVK